MKRKIIKRKKILLSGQTWNEIQKGLDNSRIGKPGKLMREGLKLECMKCRTKFTREEADKKHPKEFWRYGICSHECHIDIIGIPRDYKLIEPDSTDWLIYQRSFPDKVNEMNRWYKKNTRKIISRPKPKNRVIIRRYF